MKASMRNVVKAAAAAGMPVIYDDEAGAQIRYRAGDGFEQYQAWRPIEDDGESRRLQVALGIDVMFYDHAVVARRGEYASIDKQSSIDWNKAWATRMVVFNVADLIGADL